MTDGVAHHMDDARDDTMGCERPLVSSSNALALDADSKPLFRTTSPKIEYAASSPYYDVLLYSFTPEHEQKVKLATKTSSRLGKPTVSSSIEKVDLKKTSMNHKRSINVTTKHIRDQLQKAGTSLQTNDHDKIGDGDQSPIYDPAVHQVYIDLFRTGGDFDAHLHKTSNKSNHSYFNTNSTTNHPTLSIFAEHCVSGRYEKVKQLLENNSVRKGKAWNVMIELLETRETVLRLSPLLLVFCMLHKIGIVMIKNTDHASSGKNNNEKNLASAAEPWMKYIDQLEHNLVKVVVELLRFGASPIAKDVCGRTVYFYGASIYATPRSLNAVTMCSNAAMSAHCFGKEVILHGFDTTSTSNIESDNLEKCNGMRGLAGGYQISTGGRIVFLFGRQSEMAVSHRNIRLVKASDNINKLKFNLCNVQDRLGHSCLTELCGSKRKDVIMFLLENHHASIDIEDWTCKTIRQRSFAIISKPTTKSSVLLDDKMTTAQIVVAHALKCAKQEQKRIDNTCTACKKIPNDGKVLQVCQRCMSVRYCSKECQADHWANGGHRKECSRLRKLYSECIRIEELTATDSTRSEKNSNFEKPSHVAFDETFTVKVELIEQARDVGTHLIHIYDKTVECDFEVKLNDASSTTKYSRLLEKVKGEFVTAGTAVYLAASFDNEGVCSIYINRRKVRTW